MTVHGKFVGFDRPSIGFHRPSIGVRSPLLSPLPSGCDRVRSPLLPSPPYPPPLEGPQRRLRWDYAAGPPSGGTRENRAAAPSPLESLCKTKTNATEKIASARRRRAAPAKARVGGNPEVAPWWRTFLPRRNRGGCCGPVPIYSPRLNARGGHRSKNAAGGYPENSPVRQKPTR
jgi:hypothetical protein